MIFKVVALVAFLGACLAEEHAYSSQSIVRYDDHSHGKENSNGYKQENSYEYSNGYLQGSGYEHGYSHDEKIAVPQLKQVTVHKIAIPVVKAVPVAHYVSESSHGSESLGLSAYGHEESYSHGYHGHSSGGSGQAESSSYGHGKAAVSSQHILREDVPAKAPKDFYEHHGHPKYEFEYKVQDHHTGDNKYQHESRDGHVVKGVYSLHEADGSIRTVEYGSDKHTGFTASIKQTTKHIEEPKHKHF